MIVSVTTCQKSGKFAVVSKTVQLPRFNTLVIQQPNFQSVLHAAHNAGSDAVHALIASVLVNEALALSAASTSTLRWK